MLNSLLDSLAALWLIFVGTSIVVGLIALYCYVWYEAQAVAIIFTVMGLSFAAMMRLLTYPHKPHQSPGVSEANPESP